MKFLFRSGWGESLSIARRVEDEGNEVLLCIEGKEAKQVGDGLIPKTKDFAAAAKWADVIVFDGNSFDLPKEAEKLRKVKPVVGSSEFGDKLEHDRLFAIELVRKLGIKVPECKEFSDFNAARLFLEKQKKESGWVIKPSSDQIKTFVADDIDELLRMFDYFEHRFEELKEPVEFLLEKKHDGVEVSTEAWFCDEWYMPNGTIERNKLMEGDLGEQTGCSGNLVWRYESMDEPLLKKLFGKLAPLLKGKYKGPIDFNVMVERETGEPIFLEFSPRFGYSAIFSFAALVKDMGKLLADTALDQAEDEPMNSDFALGVRVTIPPYPNTEDGVAVDYPVFGFDPHEVDKRINPQEIRLDENGEAETSGPDGIAFEMVGVGASIPEATRACYEAVAEVKIPNMRYRRDIGVEAMGTYQELEGLGVVRPIGKGLAFSKERSITDDKWKRLFAPAVEGRSRQRS